jgi:hypothetical protein
MLEDILGLSLEEQIRRIAGVKSEFERLLSKDEVFDISDLQMPI